MNKAWLVLVVLAVWVLGVGGCTVSARNHFVALEEHVNTAWANVETVLQRRYDLIPNLVRTVQGYAAHERQILEEITRLRSQWGEARSQAEKVEVAGRLETALARLLVVVERYPDLKASQNFLALQDELAGTENRIAVERRRYNEAVQAYNTAIRRFPGNLVASWMGLQRRAPFQAAPEAAVAPKVEF